MKHLFKAELKWNLKNKVDKSTAMVYSKSHKISIQGKPILNVSAAKAFKGNAELYNPEDLFLSSLISCHMMSYLYVCSQNGIEVLSYTDHAEATLEVFPNSSGRFIEVRLNPKVIIAQSDKTEEAIALHKKANELCFIANSCNFPIHHQATVKAQ